MKTYFENLLTIIILIISLAILVAPIAIPVVLVAVFKLSGLWFLLLLFYLPIAALLMTAFDY